MAAEGRWHLPTEWLSTLLLAMAAVATAWSTYQSAQWRGDQASNTAKSTAARIDSSRASTRAGQLTQIDIATFVQWIDATVDGKPTLARFYRQRFRTEFQPAVAAWLATHPRTNPDAPKTPFAMPQYKVAQATEGKRLEALSAAYSAKAGHADQRADNYMLAVVLFATALFFAGISTKLRVARQREIVLVLGFMIFVGAVVWLATLPVQLTT
jgi:hypothetical protein